KPQDDCSTDAPESSGNSNPTVTSINPSADQIETLTVETPIPTLCREFEALMHENFQMSAMGELNFFLGLQVLQKEDGIFLFQDKYGKDGTRKDVDLHLYRSMIGSLMSLTASRLDIMFADCACARHQVTPKECHLHAVKRIFRYLKGHPKLGLWYPKESPFDLVVYSDSDYGGATQDRKSTTRGCQFFGRRLISWQCKKQIIVSTSTTKAKYVAAASCCGQVLWIQNQLLDYGDCFVKKLISVDHIHTDENVADLLTKPFDAGRFQYLVLCREFKALMHEKFQMSAMGELNFFLGLQVLQKEDGIFLSQDKYVGDIFKKFRYSDIQMSDHQILPWTRRILEEKTKLEKI
nr:hypothetical protein [Tanacetum cinerariifolium]